MVLRNLGLQQLPLLQLQRERKTSKLDVVLTRFGISPRVLGVCPLMRPLCAADFLTFETLWPGRGPGRYPLASTKVLTIAGQAPSAPGRPGQRAGVEAEN